MGSFTSKSCPCCQLQQKSLDTDLEVSHPPSYKTIVETPTHNELNINVDDIPQWKWTAAQCRAWIAEILIHRCGYGPEEAKQKALRFSGWGPTMYTASTFHWRCWFGEEGMAMFCVLIENCDKKGAAPSYSFYRTLQCSTGVGC